MKSIFSWLDYSEYERRKMIDVIHALDEKDTRDELGIGSIRDSFAEMLFPGTSTIQTRARYFLFVPWIYMDLEKRKIPSANMADYARECEIKIIYQLEASREKRGGIIGINAKDDLKRLPSNIYWQGLARWGIRLFSGSQEQYHNSLDRWYSKGQMMRNDDNDIVDGLYEPNWHPEIPLPPAGYPDKITFTLLKEEAVFLRDRILHTSRNSLLAFLVTQNQIPGESGFCWESELYAQFPADNKYLIEHARNFSESIHGAALLYNLMLAEQIDSRDLIESYHVSFEEWVEKIANNKSIFTWNRSQFWSLLDKSYSRVPQRTRLFVDRWLDIIFNQKKLSGLVDNKPARYLIREREAHLKGGLARLENARARELWTGAAGTSQLDFRWRISRQLITDILEGVSHA